MSIPVIPPVPDEPFYPVNKLYILPTFDRATYAAAFGDPPTYDGSRKTKTWFDSTALSGVESPDTLVQYLVIEKDAQGNVVPKTISMSAKEAATVNLYGIHTYPKYVVAPTTATISGTGAPINPMNLCMFSDAVALATSFKVDLTAVVESPLAITYPTDEHRRLWLIGYKTYQLTAGTLLFEMNQNNVGTPGHWDLSGAEPNWISDMPSSLPPQNPAWGTPCRPLASNEAIGVGLYGFMIYRTDKSSVYTQQPNTGGGGLTSAQDAKLTHIDNLIQALATMFGRT